MKSLRYLVAYTAHSLERAREEEDQCLRLREFGYDVEGFCVSVPGPGHEVWPMPKVAAELRRKNPDLLKMYDALEAKLRQKDVFVLWTGAMIHPELVKRLATYNVYLCSDDPESSATLSKPVAKYFDHAFTRNIACVERYGQWGCRNYGWLPIPVAGDCLMTFQSEEEILQGKRNLDVVMFCERLHVVMLSERVHSSSDRMQRIEKLSQAFPQASIRGRGWPGGFVSTEEMWNTLRRAKIGWNLHNSIGPTNGRLMQLPAFGVMQICDNKNHLGKIFKLDEEVVGFDTIEECIDKTRYYLEHDNERRLIAARGWRRAVTDYTELKQWELMLSQVSRNCLAKIREKQSLGASILIKT